MKHLLMTLLALILMVGATAAGRASAATADCAAGDAPGAWVAVTACTQGGVQVCDDVGGVFTCDMSAWCSGPSEAYVVHDASNGHDLVGFGSCGAALFCCAFDEDAGAPVGQVVLEGTLGMDELAFTWDVGLATELNLIEWDGDPIDATINGLDEADVINGSNFPDLDSEVLSGDNGDDEIRGHAGNDQLFGRIGNDDLIGGEGDDQLDGGMNDDTLCESTGEVVCATDLAQLLTGGPGDDVLWYNKYDAVPVCTVHPLLDPNSAAATAASAAGDNDTCGDSFEWAPNQLPRKCDIYTDVEPTECAP